LRGQIAYEHRHRYAICLEFARDNDVLDIACGEGYGSSLLAPVARSVTGVDIDDVAIRHAAARYPATNLVFRTGSATEIPLPDASIDVVVSFETIEHLTDHRTMLSEIVRVLRPAGRIVISSPNKRVYSDLHGVANAFHVRELYFDEFRDLLRDFFPRIRLFGQRIVGASAVHPLHGAADGTGWLDATGGKSAGIGALPDPEYFIGICGRDQSDDLSDVSSVYLDPADDLLLDIRSGGLAAAPVLAATEHVNGQHPVARNGAAATAPDESAQAAARRVLELQEELFVARENFTERLAAVETERDDARLQLIAAANERTEARERATLVEAERDAVLAESTAERERANLAEAERTAALAEATERIERLERDLARAAAHAATLERERDDVRAELGALVDDLRSEGARLEAHVLALETERAAAAAAIATLETERERTAERARDLELQYERTIEINAKREAERDAALAEIAALRTRFDEARTRIATLERARERLYERGAQVEKERDEARAATETLRDRLRDAKRLQSRTAADVALAQERLAHAVDTANRTRAANDELASHAALLESAARRSGSVVRDLGAAHTRAAGAIAALELTRRRLEFALTARVAMSEGKAARNASLAGRLREQVSVLTEALGLRERHIAALEATMRDREAQFARAREDDAAAQTAADIDAQIAFYRAMNARIRNSRLWKLRTKVRTAIGRPAD
jgi:hypothetical protein